MGAVKLTLRAYRPPNVTFAPSGATPSDVGDLGPAPARSAVPVWDMVNVGSAPVGRRGIDVPHVGHGQRRERPRRAPRDRRFPCGTWSTSGVLRLGGVKSDVVVWLVIVGEIVGPSGGEGGDLLFVFFS